MKYDLEINTIYNFTLYGSSVLGTGYKNATVMALLDFDSAIAIQDVVSLHASVYASLPSGTPVNAKDLIFVKIKTSTGEIRILAMDWISSQPTKVTSSVITVTINDTDLSQLPLLRTVLQKNGFNNFKIDTV